MANTMTAAAVETTAVMDTGMDVTVRPIAPKGKLIGFATVTFEIPGGQISIPDFRIFNGEKGLFVSNPSRPDDTSRSGYRDTAWLGGDTLKDQINVAVRDAYIAEVEKLQARVAAVATPEKPRMRDQVEKAGQEAAKHNAERVTPQKGEPARHDR